MKKLRIFAAILFIGVAVMLPASLVVAQSPSDQVQSGINSITNKDDEGANLVTIIGRLVSTFLFLIGAVAVVMIIYGGFRYITSAGEASAVSSAKNTIMYAVVGLIVALSAYAIVSFVLDSFTSSASEAGRDVGDAAREAAENAAGGTDGGTPSSGTISPSQ